MGRAVTGYPLPSGNWITTQNKYRPASVWLGTDSVWAGLSSGHNGLKALIIKLSNDLLGT